MKEIILKVPNELSAMNITVCVNEKDGSVSFGSRCFSNDNKKIILIHENIGELTWEEIKELKEQK